MIKIDSVIYFVFCIVVYLNDDMNLYDIQLI